MASGHLFIGALSALTGKINVFFSLKILLAVIHLNSKSLSQYFISRNRILRAVQYFSAEIIFNWTWLLSPLGYYIFLTFLMDRCPWIAGGRRAGGAVIYIQHSSNPTWPPKPPDTRVLKRIPQTQTHPAGPAARHIQFNDLFSKSPPVSGWLGKI